VKHSQQAVWMTLTTAACLLLTTTARAAEQAGDLAESNTVLIFKWTHFFILTGILYWLFKKVLPPIFRRRADIISEAISKAAAAKAEAERRLEEAAIRLARLEQEVAEFRAGAQKEAMAELERLRAMTKIDAEKIAAAAKAEIAATERTARVQLKALTAKLAVDGAESLVAKQMTPAVQDALIRNFLHNLEGRPN
jgi:F-type H+-transporting ATPase subunit b